MMYQWGLIASMSIKQHRSLNISKPIRRPNSELNTPLPDHKACPQNWVRIEKSTVQGEANFFHWYLNHISIKKYSKSEQNWCYLFNFQETTKATKPFQLLSKQAHTTNYCSTVLMRWGLTMCPWFSILPCQISWKFQYTHRWEKLKLIQILNLVSWTLVNETNKNK